ncbi:MAG: efflux RND transporter periplasmic adaptor subunit [Rhodocyclaceae bacterium]|nr:efflux RND transporter periplasmic adaptor subunit [Rhodocyclaceae bacterium]
MKLTRKRGAVVLGIVALLGVAGYLYRTKLNSGGATTFKSAKLERGPLSAVVSATGTLNPVVSVQVGSQVSGQIKEIFVDFNSPVKAGQLIARIDPETLQQKVRQAEADVEATQSAVAVQRAEVSRSRAILSDALRDYERKKMLVDKGFISSAERDKAQTTYDAALAGLRVTEAQTQNGEAIVRQRQAQVAQARIDLERTSIRAPVDGVVVKRSVEPGQTVAASLQAPELFVIAKNLSDMQVEASIDEADVGRVKLGQKARFTVDAFPGQNFEGEVRQVRKAATVVSNVVTYTVVISAENPQLALLPGMTANVQIATAHKDNVLKVPNAALRFRPTNAVSPAPSGNRKSSPDRGRVWVVGSDGSPLSVEVGLGLGDGKMTEITTGDLTEGSEVILGQAAAKAAATPAGPRMF